MGQPLYCRHGRLTLPYPARAVVLSTLLAAAFPPAAPAAGTPATIAARLAALEADNARLQARLAALENREVNRPSAGRIRPPDPQAAAGSGPVASNHRYSYRMLDPTTEQNRKQGLLLRARRDNALSGNGIHLAGALTALANYQRSDRDSKFGYLMRHPTAANQVGRTVSEAVLHSAQLAVTATLGNWLSGYAEMLYDPQQSFGTGTITALERNQLQLRRGFVMFGDLHRSPFHVAIGKMATPFGLTDTVNPFTASTMWHAFGGLAFGARAGWLGEHLSVTVMGMQGGAQFRAHNAPVKGTAVPSRLNNVAVDVNWRFDLPAPASSWLLGGSWQRGSAYCQGFPIFHFTPCADNNPAWDVYTRLQWKQLTVQAEFARTVDAWPGTFNPAPPLNRFAASKVTSFGLGARQGLRLLGRPAFVSADFSRFDAGPDGAPWEAQDQWVLGFAAFALPSVKLFAEYVHTKGYAPLNFLTGGTPGLPAGTTVSDRGADSDIVLLGVNAAF